MIDCIDCIAGAQSFGGSSSTNSRTVPYRTTVYLYLTIDNLHLLQPVNCAIPSPPGGEFSKFFPLSFFLRCCAYFPSPVRCGFSRPGASVTTTKQKKTLVAVSFVVVATTPAPTPQTSKQPQPFREMFADAISTDKSGTDEWQIAFFGQRWPSEKMIIRGTPSVASGTKKKYKGFWKWKRKRMS